MLNFSSNNGNSSLLAQTKMKKKAHRLQKISGSFFAILKYLCFPFFIDAALHEPIECKQNWIST